MLDCCEGNWPSKRTLALAASPVAQPHQCQNNLLGTGKRIGLPRHLPARAHSFACEPNAWSLSMDSAYQKSNAMRSFGGSKIL